MANVEVMR